MKVVITRLLDPVRLPILPKSVEITQWPHTSPCSREWLLENIKDASGVLVTLTEKVNDEFFLAAGPNLRVVSTMSVGVDHYDLDAVRSYRKTQPDQPVRIGYTPNVLTNAVADLSLLLALMVSRDAVPSLNTVQSGSWPVASWSPFSFCGIQLSSTSLDSAETGKTVGFLGFGRIAKATLHRMIPFGFKRCIYTSSSNRSSAQAADFAGLSTLASVSLEELAEQSDVLFICAPLTPSTYHVINSTFLQRMKRTSILINTARGGLVDSDALAAALKEGTIWGAGLDVVEGEPNVGEDHSLVQIMNQKTSDKLTQTGRCVILPHVGSATVETRTGMAELAVKNLLAGLGLIGLDSLPEEYVI